MSQITKTNLTKDDVAKMFKNHLIKEFAGSYKSGKFKHYWDSYYDELTSSELEKILQKANDEKAENFAQATTWYIFENYSEIEADDMQYIIDDFYEVNHAKFDEIEEALNGENFIFLTDVFYENMEYDLDVETLLKYSAPEDLTIYFGDNWDDEYSYIENEFVECFDEPEFLTNERNTPIDWLMSTQGYTREDLVSEQKRESSTFLQSLYAELFHYKNGLETCQLVAIPNSNDFEAILNLTRHKNVKINKSTEFGFFDKVYGSGCGLEIKLEKDIIIDENSPIYDVTLSRGNSFCNYSPETVYGFSRPSKGKDLKVIEDKKEEN